MSDLDIQPKIFFMPGAIISIVVSEENKLRLLEGEIKSIEEEQQTIGITLHPTNTTKTVKIENIKKVNLDEMFYANALLVSKFYNDGNGHFSMHNPNDVGNVLPKPSQTSAPPYSGDQSVIEFEGIDFVNDIPRAYAKTVNPLKSGLTSPPRILVFIDQ